MTRPARRWVLFVRKTRWGVTWLGVGCLILSGAIGAALFLRLVHPFLAVTSRVDSQILVMEGWLHPPAVSRAMDEFKNGHYDFLVTTGGPVPSGRVSAGTWADSGAYWLRQEGFPVELVRKAPAAATTRDRTYYSALGLKSWLDTNAPNIKRLNIVTEGAHARRTRLLFEKALGDDYAIGIVATQNPEYDPDHWWRSSEGVRETLGEAIAYLYARILFRGYPNETVRG